MKPVLRRAILAAVAVASVTALGARTRSAWLRSEPAAPPVVLPPGAPRVVELGSNGCASCRAMRAELGRLRAECGDSIEVVEIDVVRDRAAWQHYGAWMIPTQVFFDSAGREIGRHAGFASSADIRRRLAAHGVECRA